MKKTPDTVLVLGPGPVTLGQGAVFQYTAARICRYLRKAGNRVVVLEDNPATLMDVEGDDGGLYLEPPVPEVVARVAEDTGAGSLWVGAAGRRGWLLAMRLSSEGWLERAGLKAADMDDRLMWTCGDRSLLRELLEEGGLPNPVFSVVSSLREGQEAAERTGLPLVARPHFSSGGWGAGLAYNLEELPPLLEEALRESPNHEVLLEEALIGWRKYVACILRDTRGRTVVAGMGEQIEPLPRHEDDSVVVFPPLDATGDALCGLEEICRELADILGLVGLAEVKLAASPDLRRIYVLDVNPGPRRMTPFLEMMRGEDLVGTHVDLVYGKSLDERGRAHPEPRSGEVLLALPRFFFSEEERSEGYMPLRCRSVGKAVVRGEDAGRAALLALRAMKEFGASEFGEKARRSLEDLLKRYRSRRTCADLADLGRVYRGAAGAHGDSANRTSAGEGGVSCADTQVYGEMTTWLVRTAEPNNSGSLLFVGVDEAQPGGGHENHFNLYRALSYWKKRGGTAAAYVTDAAFGLLLAEVADAVCVGPPRPEGVLAFLAETGITRMCAHFGGRSSLALVKEVEDVSIQMELLGRAWGEEELPGNLALLRDRGIPTVNFAVTRQEAQRLLERARFPVLATDGADRGKGGKNLCYRKEEVEEFVARAREGFLLRELGEDVQEVMVEALAGEEDALIVLLWERLEETGSDESEGPAVYPPANLTSEQCLSVERLVRDTLQVLGWVGSLSMRLVVNGEGARLWDVRPGTSVHLPFLSRAASLPLPEMALRALIGESIGKWIPFREMVSVRYPVAPMGMIAGGDIMPSAYRRSTGSVMGMGEHPGCALAKVLHSLGMRTRTGGCAFLSVANREKRRAVLLARELCEAGYRLAATRGTARALMAAGFEVEVVNKLREGRPNVLDHLRNGRIDLVINIPRGKHPHSDGFYIREDAARHGIPCITDMEVAMALVRGIRAADRFPWKVMPLAVYPCWTRGPGGD